MKQSTLKNNKWNIKHRLAYIDFRLKWFGQLNRSDLIDQFGISVPQASLDISLYTDLAPENVEYNRSLKVYVRKSTFQSIFPKENSASSFLSHLLSSVNEEKLYRDIVSLIPVLGRSVDDDITEKLVLAIQHHKLLQIKYQSLSHGEPTTRTIFPKILVFDGSRWHVRAFCLLKRKFLDFVIARIISISESPENKAEIPLDENWNSTVSVFLEPKLELSDSQKKIVEQDFNMTNHQLEIHCKKAHLFYLIKNYRLLDPWLDPQLQVIQIKNVKEVMSLLSKRELRMLINKDEENLYE